MQAGQVDDIDQGGSQPRFAMSGGRVIGGLTNGGLATITGGRIGSVALTAPHNTFFMSGGVIDHDLTAVIGDVSMALSGGNIGGPVPLGDGANSLAMTGGTIGGALKLGNGANTVRLSG